ncbi:multicopper oxidase family protein [Agitococcus lubricus]|uniref:FtsP/CotA-like multicopper oxidase with cupredoxin domain n=1 Tax=Agitococcus lubricus TaxID=1077255 RepID=A0A2T5IVE2_9GAMM|nr:copper oxidase [Agitococcus lubricus]PTQ87850.1 FtsP/CotA-like multicopper oxidase with cupredoxin domain [Agitococcus lubricus]
MNRRQLFTLSALSTLVSSVNASVKHVQKTITRSPFQPVKTLGVPTAAWQFKAGAKEFHLIAEPVVRQFANNFYVNAWGYNGSTPGPTIEVIEGDRVRILVTNKLPEKTSVHWHGLILPNGMDGVGGLTQTHIPVGETYVYEFIAKDSGTFMYHSHSDEMFQMAMGAMGMFIVHPKHPHFRPVDHDFAFMLMSWDIDAGTYTPKPHTMTDFNTWSMNSLVFPAIPHMVVKQGDRVRIRLANLSMTNHPIHLHGHRFKVSATDGGWIPEALQYADVTTDVPVGAIRVIEFIADNLGDWAFHCHKSHHTMGPMGHSLRNMLGVKHDDIAAKVQKLMPEQHVMAMGENGMGDMGEMVMSLPENTLPMMTGQGPFGSIEMGGMFTVLKVRQELPAQGEDVGWYTHPKGTVAAPYRP